MGIFETKSRGDDEFFGGFNLKTKCKAEALHAWKSQLIEKGRKVRAGIVIVDSEKIMMINESDKFDIDKAIKGDFTDWKPF